MTQASSIATLPILFILSGCIVFEPPTALDDGGPPDAGDPSDSGRSDAGMDAGSDAGAEVDAGAADAGPGDAGPPIPDCVVASIVSVDDCPGPILINEVDGSGSDFVEIYNAGSDPVNISGYVLADESAGAPDVADGIVIPDGVVLEPGSFLYVWANLGAPQSGIRTADCIPGAPPPCVHAAWGISAGGEHTYLLDDTLTIICDFEYPAAVFSAEAFGRIPDGATTLCPTNSTPGEINTPSSLR